MVIRSSFSRAAERGSLMIECIVAIAIMTIALLPVAYSTLSEKRLARASYERAIAMEIVDGEMEMLLAGGWHQLEPGTHEYLVHANAASNLSPGKFLVTVTSGKVRLEWKPETHHQGGPVIREALVQ